MHTKSLEIAVFGGSSGKGPGTTYRSLVRELAGRGHRVTFYARDARPDAGSVTGPEDFRLIRYDDLERLAREYEDAVEQSDLVIVGSSLPEGRRIIDWITSFAPGVLAFHDLDTPRTLEGIRNGTCEYLDRRQVPWFDLYLSVSGGRVLLTIERELGSPAARPFYGSFDPALSYPERVPSRWDLAYLGDSGEDLPSGLDELLLEPARRWSAGRFAVAGVSGPDAMSWPQNVERPGPIGPGARRAFYAAQRFALNLTAEPAARLGWSPSAHLFEAAACGAPILTDVWPGVEDFFEPGREIVLCESAEDVLRAARDLGEVARGAIAARARERALRYHTAAHRALELERYYTEAVLLGRLRPRVSPRPAPNRDDRPQARA